jgi:hypothetical protein
MMKQLLSGEQVNSKTGVVITATQSSASRVQLVEGGRGSEIRLLPPPEKPDESDNAEWVSIHIPLERLDGLALGAGARLRRSWLGPALASTIILAGLVLGATGAKTLPYASTSTATAASAVESSKMPPPRRPSVVVVRAKGTKQPTSAKPVERHAAMVKPSRLAAKAG